MSTVVTDLLGKRVTVSRRLDGDPQDHVRVVTGVVRGVASSSETSITLLVQVEETHIGTCPVGALATFVIGYYEVFPKP